MMTFEEVDKSGLNLIRIDLTKENYTSAKVTEQVQKGISVNSKYVILYKYCNKTTYKEYLTLLDKIYQVIFEKRNQLAQEKYKLNYDDLAVLQQKEVGKVYPLTLMERNVDQPEE
jgi:aryl-phospho-beta-D-glucosidase BglC (GH1 family)